MKDVQRSGQNSFSDVTQPDRETLLWYIGISLKIFSSQMFGCILFISIWIKPYFFLRYDCFTSYHSMQLNNPAPLYSLQYKLH